MAPMQDHSTVQPDEMAAALAAVYAYLAEEDVSAEAAEPQAHPWQTATVLNAQQQTAARNGAYRTWGTVERSNRSNRWSYGITGL